MKGVLMRRFIALAVTALAIVFTLSYVVPAMGGPTALSSASPLSLAKKAFKKAKKADKNARKAGKKADQALAKLNRKEGFLGTTITTVSSAPKSIAQGAVDIAAVECPAGTVVISGGYSLIGPEANVFSDRKSGNGWAVGGDNTAATLGPATLTVDAQCAATGTVATASRSARADRLRDRRLLEAQRAANQRR